MHDHIKPVMAGIFISVLLIAGCATPSEREAWSELDREQDFLEGSTPDPYFGDSSYFNGQEEEVDLNEDSDLDDFLCYAALHHPGLRAAFYRWKAALEKVPQERSLPDPKFTYGYYIREVETRVGSLEQSFGLSQGIPWPSKLTKRAEAALRNARVQKYLFDAKKLELFYEVRKAYYEYYYLSRSIKIFKTNIQLLENIEASIQARYKAGTAENPAWIRIQVELGKLEDRLISLQKLKPALASKLNAAIGREGSVPIPWPKKRPEEPPPQKQEDLLSILMEDNPELNAARARIRAAEADEALAETQYFPDLGIGANYTQADRRRDMNVSDNGKDPFLLTFQISLPIWGNRYAAGVREAQAKQLSAVRTREDLQNRLSSDVIVALYEYDDAARKLNLYGDTLIPKAEQALKTSQQAFAGERAQYLDMIDAERQLLEFRLMEERALVDRNIRLAELEKLCGRTLRRTDFIKNSAQAK